MTYRGESEASSRKPKPERGAEAIGATARERDLVVGSLVGFGHLLRRVGIRVDSGQIKTAVRALGAVEPADRDSAYWALRCSLLTGKQQELAFDAAFDAFWAADPIEPQTLQTEPSPRGDPGASDPEGGAGSIGEGSGQDNGAGPEAGHSGFSATERLRPMDIKDYGPEEAAAARRLFRSFAPALPRRHSRRSRSARRGSQLDYRATLRAAIRSDGHPLELAWRRCRTAPRRLLFLIDVSGSMEPYARVTLVLGQVIRRASRRTEVFSFGTRLTRLTRELDEPDPIRAIERAADAVTDWAGGTRIGDSIRAFNRTWGRRGAARGAVVVVVSDGWERGDVSTLEAEIERLHRSAHTLIWVNPLASDPSYEPLVAGMAAALPFVDAFVPGGDLAGFEALREALNGLPISSGNRRTGRRPAGIGDPGRKDI